ncbi:MAG: SDR family NAD(P)-dependent oxidoreductase [Burkholderiales bacterium]
MELKDKVAIVTGSGRGIGEGIAMVMAREGARLVIVDMNLDDAKAVAARIEAGGGKAIAAHADISKKADVDAVVAQAVAAFGTVDVLVNNAGIEATPCLVHEMTEAQWDRVIGVNLKGTFFCCQAVIPAMIAKGGGRIVNIASTAALRMTFFGSVDYTVSKHGVAGLTQHLAWELADFGITVNSVCPGGVLTPLMEQHTTPEFREQVVKRLIPLGRMDSIGDIGEAVSFLASDRAAMVTGQMFAVDGGLLTGFGEDLRPLVRKRMADAKAAKAAAPKA